MTNAPTPKIPCRYLGSFVKESKDGRTFFSFGFAREDQPGAFSLTNGTDCFAEAGANAGATFNMTGVKLTLAEGLLCKDGVTPVYHTERKGEVVFRLIANGGIRVIMDPE